MAAKKHKSRAHAYAVVQPRAELKVTEPKVTEPNLRFPAVFCENLRFAAENLQFSAVCCALHMLDISRRRGESAKICGFLRKSAVSNCCALQMLEISRRRGESAKICSLLRKICGFLRPPNAGNFQEKG